MKTVWCRYVYCTYVYNCTPAGNFSNKLTNFAKQSFLHSCFNSPSGEHFLRFHQMAKITPTRTRTPAAAAPAMTAVFKPPVCDPVVGFDPVKYTKIRQVFKTFFFLRFSLKMFTRPPSRALQYIMILIKSFFLASP